MKTMSQVALSLSDCQGTSQGVNSMICLWMCVWVGGLWSVCGCMNHVERSLNVWGGVSQNLWSYSCLWGYVSGCEVSTHFFGMCPCIWGVWPDLERTFQYLRSLQCLWVAFQFVRSLIYLGGISADMRFLICLIMCLPECWISDLFRFICPVCGGVQSSLWVCVLDLRTLICLLVCLSTWALWSVNGSMLQDIRSLLVFS